MFCNRAFICKIEVFKDGLEDPLELTVDELLMKKILAGGTKNLCFLDATFDLIGTLDMLF